MIRWVRRLAASAPVVLAGHADVVIVGALAAVAVAPFGRLFGTYAFLGPAGVGAAIAVGSSLVLRRRSFAVSMVAGLTALAAWVVVGVFGGGVPGPGEIADVWDASVDSWARMLTAGLPVPRSPDLLVLPVVIAWAAAFAGAQLALRRRSPGLPVVPAAGAYTLALAYAGRRAAGPAPFPLLFVLLALSVVLLRANMPPGQRRRARAGGGQRLAGWAGAARLGLPVAAVASVVAVAVAPALPGSSAQRRFDLHDRYRPPIDVAGDVSPLARLGGQLHQDGPPLFTVTFSGIPVGVAVDRVRVATLDRYDGTVWASDATFVKAGRQLPLGDEPSRDTAAVGQTYVLKNWSSALLPALDRPTSVLVAGKVLGTDAASGMLTTGTAPFAGLTYRIESRVATDPGGVDAGRIRPGNAAAVSTLALPPNAAPWPAKLLAAANALAPGARDAEQMLRSMQARLASQEFGYSVDAPAGHSLRALTAFLAGPDGAPAGAGRVGSAEQFAAAFAVVARIRGLPSRVVVGYRVDPDEARRGRTITVFPKDVHAWAEVNLNGVGWVQFDPTNPNERKPVEPETSEVAQIPTVPATTVPPGEQSSPTIPPLTPPTHEREASTVPIRPFVLVALVGVLPAAAVVGARRARRRRRRRGPPAAQVVGAWLEARDRLRLRGLVVDRSWTVAQQARRIAGSDGQGAGVPARVWAFERLVDQALYAPDPPGQALADEAWAAEAALGGTLRDGVGLVPRVRAAIDPRPLLPEGRGRSKVPAGRS